MKKFKGRRVNNAEITIDYKENKVKAEYPSKEVNNIAIYAGGRKYLTLFIIIIILFVGLMFVKMMKESDINKMSETCVKEYRQLNDTRINILRSVALIGIMLGIWLLKGYANIIYYSIGNNKTKYAEDMAKEGIIKNRKWTIINLKEKRFDNAIKIGKKIIIIDYNIVNFEYRFFSKENRITKIETKTIQKPRKGKEVYNFICIITFKKKPKEGILIYK